MAMRIYAHIERDPARVDLLTSAMRSEHSVRMETPMFVGPGLIISIESGRACWVVEFMADGANELAEAPVRD